MKWHVTASPAICKVKWPKLWLHCTQMSKIIAKRMPYIINELSSDFQLSGYLYMPFNGQLSTHECLTSLRNKCQQKQTSELLAVVFC